MKRKLTRQAMDDKMWAAITKAAPQRYIDSYVKLTVHLAYHEKKT